MEFKAYLRLLWRWSWLIVLVMMLSGAAAYFISRQITPVYASSTTFLITRRSGTEFSFDLTARLTGTYAQLLLRRPILEEVIANLGLNTTVKDLQDQLTITIDESTMLISLEVRDDNPEQAAAIASEVLNVVSNRALALLGNDQEIKRSALQVVEVPQIDPLPIAPRPVRNALLVSILGGLLAAGVLFFKSYLDDAVQSSEQAATLAGVPVLAVVGQARRARLIDTLLLRRKDDAIGGPEAYQLLRAKIEYAGVKQPVKTILVTSSKQHEGKSTVLAQLAIAMAQVGRRVVVIDADLRNPSLHTLFRVSNTRGLTTALAAAQDKPVSEYLTPSGIENVLLLTSGPQVGDVVSLLESQKLAGIISQLRASADIVLFDSAPVLAVIDAALLARQCDATLLVVRPGVTRTDELRKAQSQFNWFNIQPFGLVINSGGSALKRSRSRPDVTRSGRPSTPVEEQASRAPSGADDSSLVLPQTATDTPQ